MAGRFLPADTIPRASIVGLLWGWLPCGLTYSVLAIALVSGSALNGAALMLAFGLGTSPNLIAAGMLLTRASLAAGPYPATGFRGAGAWIRHSRPGARSAPRRPAAPRVVLSGLRNRDRITARTDRRTGGARTDPGRRKR